MTPAARRWIHRGVVAAGLLPALGLVFAALRDELGANPVEQITHVTGEFALRFLLLSLAVTPLRRGFRWAALAPYRRSFGLLCFFYAALHFATYLGLDLALDFGALLEDVLERPYITVGFATFLVLLPLAITSTRGWQRRLGRRWLRLHRLVYAAGIGAVLHFLWLAKADLQAPLIHAGLLCALLGARFLPGRAQTAGKRNDMVA